MILVPAFQPIKEITTGRLVAAEVLSRWRRVEQVLSPLEVETSIDWGSVDIALAQFLCHLKSGYERLFINVSAETLESVMDFHTWSWSIKSLIRRNSAKVVIEITERIPDSLLQSRWEVLSTLGAELALDDFGDQHSTFERLRAYPWDYCKFTAKRLSYLADYPAIVYCQKHAITAIAEQIETAAQAERAKRLGLLWQQGFRHARPAVLNKQLNEQARQTRSAP